jgi:Zn-dependent peptidase ImmA (M78 family)
MGDDVELSWDDAEWRTVPTGIVLSEGTGAALVPAALVAERLYDWSRAIAVGCRGRCDANVLAELDDQLGGLRSQTRAVSRLQIAAGLQSLERAARRLISLAGVQATGLQHVLASMLGAQDGAASPCLVAPLTVPVLLFRSSAPSLTEADIDQLLGLVPRSVEEVPVEFPPRKPTPCPLEPRDATQSGYDLALDFREWLGLSETEPLLDAQDLEKVLFPKLGLCVRDVALTDVRTEGASVYVEGHRPTIAINAAGRFSATRWGRRMTLAHELCHLLHDGGSAGGVGVVSNPWAPYLMERRANAFAAHFLAPPAALHALLGESSATWTAEDLGDVMKKLGIGAHTLVRQLQNMRWIGEPEADAWLGELAGEV